jgi:predicted NBD/HSP70 family sugar kinase
MQIHSDHSLGDQVQPLACVEIGGGSVQTVLFANGDRPRLLNGAHRPDGAVLACAVPGLISKGIVLHASNLGWRNIDPVEALGLEGPAAIVMNDAEAAALGEAALRGSDGLGALVYLCIGTGIGGAVVRDGNVLRSNLFGHNAEEHGSAFGDLKCRCGRRGCLETVAAGWALPDPLTDEHLYPLAGLLSAAVDALPLADEGTVVIGGGIARRYPQIVTLMKSHFTTRNVDHTRAPYAAKSAAAWGLRYALQGTVEALV